MYAVVPQLPNLISKIVSDLVDITDRAANQEWERGCNKAAKIYSEVNKASGPRLLNCVELGWRSMYVDW
jgi:hypothetical protein